MKDLGKILTYFFGVIILGALLAPPLYWAGQAVAARGVLEFLGEVQFQKYFNRGALIAAIVLLWPTIRWLKIPGVRELGIEPDALWVKRLLAGFVIAGVLVFALGVVYVYFDIYRWKSGRLAWGRLPSIMLSAVAVSLVEETLFRAGMLGLFLRSLSARAAILWTSIIFAAVHFLKPDDEVVVAKVDWLTGFELIPHTFYQFSEPTMLMAGFTIHLVLGLMLADVTIRTRSLWMAIGLHAGVVFSKMSFSKFTKREEAYLPWVGESLEIGLVPVGVLSFVWLLAHLWLRYVDRPSLPPRS